MNASRVLATACSLLFVLGATSIAWAGTQASTATPNYPPARYWHSMASNGASASTTSRIYMFGGNAGLPNTAYLSDLWYYSASSGIWTPLTPTGRSWPQLGRGNGALSCGGGKCVLFTGTSGTKYLNETWVFAEPVGINTAVGWTKVACSKPGACPAARMLPLMAFDPTRGYHVSVGGINDSPILADTWTFNGSKWTRRSVNSQPAVRSQGSAAFVPTHVSNGTAVEMNKVVIFGGNPYPNDPYPAALCNMYSWNGSAWEAISSNQGPCLVGATMAWDTSVAGNPRLMVAGGFKDAFDTTNTNTETWYFTFTSSTSGTWALASGSGCAPLMGAVGGYDVPSKKLVFFGGSDRTGYAYGDTLVCP